MKIKNEMIKREIAGDIVLVPVGKTVLNANGLFVMNEQGAFIWDLLPEAKSAEDIVGRILAEYDVTEEIASHDVAEFLGKLRQMDIIE